MYSAVYDAIGRYEHSLSWEKEIPNKTITYEHLLEDQDLDSLKALLGNTEAVKVELCHSEVEFCCEGSAIESSVKLTYNLTEEQKGSELKKCTLYRSNAVRFITKSLERKPDQKDTLKQVLENKELLIPELEKLLK
jgi:hypothetical protein